MSPEGQRHTARLATVAFVRHADAVLLHRHGAGSDRFRGLWNGIGGHVEPGEDVLAAARRELREEAGVDVPLHLRGVVHESGLLGHAYVIFFFVGEATDRAVRPAPGVELRWQPVAALGELPLVGDVASLLPRLLAAREPLFATQRFDGGDRIVSDAAAPAPGGVPLG